MDTFRPNLWQRIRLFFEGDFVSCFSATVPSITMYGGATITAAHDATGAEFVICCAKDNGSGAFGLYGLKNDVIILARPVSGRGSVWISQLDGRGRWIGWEGSTKFGGEIPGFAPLPMSAGSEGADADLDDLEQRIATLEATIMNLPPTTTGPVVNIPARTATDGGRVQLQYAGGSYFFDVYNGVLRAVKQPTGQPGKVLQTWE